MKMSREWAMPSGDTFSAPPISRFVDRWLEGLSVVIDPFARNARRGTITNDLNPDIDVDYHMDGVAFMEMLVDQGVRADAVILDPPFSARQINELYARTGLDHLKSWTNAKFHAQAKNAANRLCDTGTVVLSFGWNSGGMGLNRGYDLEEVLLVPHGGSHNDTICVAERKHA